MTRRMYLDPEYDMSPHIGEHDENSYCSLELTDIPTCVPAEDRDRGSTVARDADTAGKDWDRDYRPPPKHYDANGIDPWAVWDAFDLDRYTANAVKYLLRAGKKDIAPRLDDLKKARDYVNKAIEMEEGKDV